MTYLDGSPVQLGDEVEVDEEVFEPELATVVKIQPYLGIEVAWRNPHILPKKMWVNPQRCELIERRA